MIIENIPGTSATPEFEQTDSGERFLINESFVDLSQFSVDAEDEPLSSPIPICHLLAYQQSVTASVTVPDIEVSSTDDSSSEDEYVCYFGIKKRRLN